MEDDDSFRCIDYFLGSCSHMGIKCFQLDQIHKLNKSSAINNKITILLISRIKSWHLTNHDRQFHMWHSTYVHKDPYNPLKCSSCRHQTQQQSQRSQFRSQFQLNSHCLLILIIFTMTMSKVVFGWNVSRIGNSPRQHMQMQMECK